MTEREELTREELKRALTRAQRKRISAETIVDRYPTLGLPTTSTV